MADDDGSPGLRDRLALSTRYLANWYKATSATLGPYGASAQTQAVWWQKIDSVHQKVQDTYNELLQPLNLYFLSPQAKADYNAASSAWAELWRELELSTDTVDISLIDQVASFADTLIEAPSLILPSISNSLGKAIGGTIGAFLAQTWPYLAGAGLLYGIYVFRRPLVAIIGRIRA